MVGCANPETGLRLFVQLPDGKRRHAINDSSASKDCKEILSKGRANVANDFWPGVGRTQSLWGRAL